jgi:hypothetical protein
MQSQAEAQQSQYAALQNQVITLQEDRARHENTMMRLSMSGVVGEAEFSKVSTMPEPSQLTTRRRSSIPSVYSHAHEGTPPVGPSVPKLQVRSSIPSSHGTSYDGTPPVVPAMKASIPAVPKLQLPHMCSSPVGNAAPMQSARQSRDQAAVQRIERLVSSRQSGRFGGTYSSTSGSSASSGVDKLGPLPQKAVAPIPERARVSVSSARQSNTFKASTGGFSTSRAGGTYGGVKEVVDAKKGVIGVRPIGRPTAR